MERPDDTPSFVGDELSATGFRLAGVRTESPGLAGAERAFRAACARSRLVLLTAEYAAAVSDELVAQARRGGTLVAVVPDLRQAVALPDAGARLRVELGIQS
jgi:vacuolar-type H+-ATPase subunit F/Vma7